MHEAGIAQGLLDAAIDALPPDGRERMKIVHLTVAAGVLAGVERECLAMYFGELSRGTPAEGAQLDLRIVPAELVCGQCGRREEYDAAGPVAVRCECGGPNELQGGRDEIILESIEVQQPISPQISQISADRTE